MANPITKVSIRLPKPLPRHLTGRPGEEVPCRHHRPQRPGHGSAHAQMRASGGGGITPHPGCRRALPEQALRGISGKGGKDRVVYLSNDARSALEACLKRRSSKARRIFLVQKGPLTGTPLSVRGIQKRIEYYARESKIKVSCHSLRHTMATQLLNADADLSTIQDLLGHSHITTTQRYCKVSNVKVQRDYYKAIELVMQRGQAHNRDRHDYLDKAG